MIQSTCHAVRKIDSLSHLSILTLFDKHCLHGRNFFLPSSFIYEVDVAIND